MTIEETQTTEEPQSDIRQALEAAYEKVGGDAPETAEKPHEKQISDQPDVGTEVKSEKEAKPVADSQGAFNSTELENGPKSWAANDRQHWKTLPDDIKKVILRREQQVYKHITETGSKIGDLTQQYRDVDAAFKPFEADLKAAGLTRGKVIQELLQEHKFRNSDPKQYIQALANKHKIDLLDIAIESDSKEAPEIKRQRWELEQERSALASERAQQEQYRNQAEMQQYVETVSSWANESQNGQKLRPHFQEVRGAMEQMLPHAEREYPYLAPLELLQMVYDRALEHPSFAHLTAAKTASIKAQSASIGGRSGITSSANTAPKTMRDAIEAAYNELTNR